MYGQVKSQNVAKPRPCLRIATKAGPITYDDADITAADAIESSGKSGPSSRKCPECTSPLFPKGREIFVVVCDRIRVGTRGGVRLDCGSWAAFLSRSEIEELLVEIFGPYGAYEARYGSGPLQHVADSMRTMRLFIEALPPDLPYAVVVEEF